MMPTLDIDLQNFLINAILRGAGAIGALLVGRWLAGVMRRLTRRAMQRTKVTSSIVEISERSAFYGTLLIALLIALVILGVSPQALVTVVGVIAIIAAVALRESLRDLAATVIFLVFQPFEPGDLIGTNGEVGYVQEILMFSTVLHTQDNRNLIIPNGNIQNSNLVNYSVLDKIRLDINVRLSYADDLRKAKETLLELAHADTRVLQEPASSVDVMELNETEVGLVLRVYTKPEDYWALRPALTEKIKLEFDARGFTIPFPQMNLHLQRTRENQSKSDA